MSKSPVVKYSPTVYIIDSYILAYQIQQSEVFTEHRIKESQMGLRGGQKKKIHPVVQGKPSQRSKVLVLAYLSFMNVDF